MDRGNGIQPFPPGGFRGGFVERVGHDGGTHSLAWVIFALLLVLLLIAIVSLALDAYYRSQPGPGRVQTATGALALLDLRYARGEVERDAYLQSRADLSGAEAATLVMPAPSEPEPQGS
jgi:putative membrane protein